MVRKLFKKEIQAIVLKNASREIKLAVLVLENGQAPTIFAGIKEILDKFDLWKSIKMIKSDTTNVNTGKYSGVVATLQSCYREIGVSVPQFVGYQHHILDLILKHVMNDILISKTTSPNISHDFVSELVDSYDSLKHKF